LIFDVDDFHAENHRLDLLERLRDANPDFRMTAFAVPAFCPPAFLDSLPGWIEVAVHGWDHGGKDCHDAYEAAHWTYEQALDVLLAVPGRFVDGFKAPGWQISDETYLALEELGWWVADQHYNDARRPASLRVHCEGDGDHLHCHVQDVCGNGLEETWPSILGAVERADTFQFVSEAASAPAPVAT
jgi:hypothetical protein